ncbi:MAG: hypothetical protein ACR5LA_05715, partial [Wolbachia sp.]
MDSGKFNEEEKFNALRLAIIQGNVQEVEAFLSYVNDKSKQAALELAMSAPRKAFRKQLVKIQPRQSLANSLEQTIMLRKVTSVVKLM